MTNRGIKVTKHILDDKTSGEYLQAIKCNGMTYEKVPQIIHCQNTAEKVIGTFKDHFQVIIAGVDRTFPMHLWDCLLPKVENALNMLRPTIIASKISAYAYMNGQHDFNKMPLVPMGCAVLLHNKPDNRKSWDAHASKGFYLKTL